MKFTSNAKTMISEYQFKSGVKKTWSAFNFVNTYFWKSIYAPFMAFVLPAVLLVILGNLFRIEYSFPGIISLSLLLVSMLIIPLTLSDLKKTSAFKFLGASPIGKARFTLVVLGYFVIVSIIAVAVLFGVLMIAFHKDVFTSSNTKRWIVDTPDISEILKSVTYYDGSVLSGIISVHGFFIFLFSAALQMILGTAIGLLIVTLTKTPQQALTISISVILPTMFLSGMVISVDIIAESPALKWISRFIPFTYTTGNIVESMTPLSHLNIYISGNFVPDTDHQGYWTYTGAIGTLKTNKLLQDMVLRDQYQLMSHSSRNIFDFSTNYVVRKVPSVDKIQDFMKTFLAGGDPNHVVPDTTRFSDIWQHNILKNDYGFLELFFNQNNILYTGVEKALNIFIPVGISVAAYWYSIKHFKWSVR